MKLKLAGFILIFLTLGSLANPCHAQIRPSEGVSLSSGQWLQVQDRFEKEIAVLLTWLEKYESHKKTLTANISDLQNQTARLRTETMQESNVFKEIHLKQLLNELRDRLQENSDLDHEADLKQKDIEQKCLSLIELYNSRIEMELEAGEGTPTPTQLDQKVNHLTELARKRNQLQTLLKQYRKNEAPEKLASIGSLASYKTNDRENLQLTLDLFKDRQKNLQDQLGKWSLEMEGLRNELKLQGEMKDFLSDIQSLNADSNFAQGHLKQGDLEFLSADSQKKKISIRLLELQEKMADGQKLLAQINQLLSKTQSRLDALDGRIKQ